MTESEVWETVRAHTRGRLVVVVDGEAEIFPVDYQATGDQVTFLTSPGTKLRALQANPAVVFEIDGADDLAQSAWSVVVRGTATHVRDDGALAAATVNGLATSLDFPKYEVVVITPTTASGRRFRLDSAHRDRIDDHP
ncbi:pyridoxamine 5'-phosphate oxidase family protein [Tsukamurella soli]